MPEQMVVELLGNLLKLLVRGDAQRDPARVGVLISRRVEGGLVDPWKFYVPRFAILGERCLLPVFGWAAWSWVSANILAGLFVPSV